MNIRSLQNFRILTIKITRQPKGRYLVDCPIEAATECKWKTNESTPNPFRLVNYVFEWQHWKCIAVAVEKNARFWRIRYAWLELD
jgi:hypothetical protein